MKYCVTGGSGFIGSYFCEMLAKDGHEITIIDLVEPPATTQHDRFVYGDVRDPKAVRDACEGADRIVHLAAAHHDFGIERDTFFDVNEGSAKVLCAVMDELGIKDVCFYSTVAVYGAAPEPRTEETPPLPETPYGASKLAGEKVFHAWTGKGEGRHCLVIRPTVTFGPRNFANMYTLIDSIQRGRFLIVGKGSNIKSLSYVEHILEATMHVWNQTDRPAFDVLNYIDKPDLTSMQITQAVYASLDKKVPVLHPPYWLVRLMAVPFDIVIALTGKNLPISSARVKKMYRTQTKYEADKIREAGYTPSAPLAACIAKMSKWYLATGSKEKAVWHLPPAKPVMRD